MTVSTGPARFRARRSPQPSPNVADDGRAAPGAAAEPGGIWAIERGELVCLAASDVGDATVLVPSEEVLIAAVDLPLRSRRERLAALPFALEDQIAEPIGEVHVALGAELAPQRHLAAAVRHRIMAGWLRQVMDAGLVRCAMLPDALALPVPEPGGWSVQAAHGRALVRAADGTGFATPLERLPALWDAAERPLCVAYGEPLPAEVPSVQAEIALEPLTTRIMVPTIDLRQGLYARPRRALPASGRKIAAIIAAGALAHGAIAIVDTLALERIAERRRAEAQELARRYVPGALADEAFAAEVNQLLTGAGRAPPSGFFPLLVEASAALNRVGPGAGLQGVSYDAAGGTLALDVQDPTAASRFGAVLAAGGLQTSGGVGTRVVVRNGATR